MNSMVLVYMLWALFGLFLKNQAYKREMFYRRNEHHQNMLPENADVNLIGFSNASLAECSKQCLLGGANCLGVFHNKETQSCKLLYDHLVEGLVFQTQTDWNFFSVNPCQIGWTYYKENCYYLNQTGTTWESARFQCLTSSSHLAEIESIEENSWILGTLAPAQCFDSWVKCVFWIGGNDLDNEGSFVWSSDNTALDFDNWSPVEPNSYTDYDDCIVVIYPEGAWADFGCTAKVPFLCKKKLNSVYN